MGGVEGKMRVCAVLGGEGADGNRDTLGLGHRDTQH